MCTILDASVQDSVIIMLKDDLGQLAKSLPARSPTTSYPAGKPECFYSITVHTGVQLEVRLPPFSTLYLTSESSNVVTDRGNKL